MKIIFQVKIERDIYLGNKIKYFLKKLKTKIRNKLEIRNNI